MKLAPVMAAAILILCFVAAPVVFADPVGTEQVAGTKIAHNEILNETQQQDLIDLVVFAFTIGIIMLVLGFAMGVMFIRRR